MANMDKLKQFLLLLSAVGLWQTVSAAENGCARFPEVVKTGLSNCDCGSGLASKYQLTDDSGHQLVLNNPDMSLVAICEYRKEYGDPYGYYFFRGQVTTTGTIERKEYAAWGDRIRFNEQMFRALLHDDSKSKKNLKIPEISHTNTCWSTKATLTITQFLQCIGEGDTCTNHILEFNVDNIGKYEKCKRDY